VSATSVAFALVGTAFMLIWSTVMYAHVDERQRRAAYRDLIARAAIRRRHDREQAEIRYNLQALDHVVRPLSADTAQPTTQPITIPTRDDGPPTEPVQEVAARQVRALMEPTRAADWVEEEMKRFNFSGRNR